MIIYSPSHEVWHKELGKKPSILENCLLDPVVPVQLSTLVDHLPLNTFQLAFHEIPSVNRDSLVKYFICIGVSFVTEKAMTTHSSVLAWRIPVMVEPGGLQSMESHRVGHD